MNKSTTRTGVVASLFIAGAIAIAVSMMWGSLSVDEAGASGGLCFGRVPTIVGTYGDDIISGTAGDDIIFAGGGDDVIQGKEGNDLICAANGDDEIDGGPGDDRIRAGDGDDDLDGGAGTDDCNGGPGTDAAANCEAVVNANGLGND